MYHSHTFPTIRGAWRRTRAAWHPSDKIIDGTGNRRNQQVGLMLSMWDTNRLVSQTRVPIAACREPAGKLWQLCMVLYVFEHKTRYILNPCSIYPHCGILTHRQLVRGALTRHRRFWCAILIAHQIVMAKHGGSCVHFSGISTCGRTSRETVSHSQRQPLPTPHKIALPVYVTVTNKRLQPLTTTLYNSLVLSFSLLITKRRLIKHRSFLRVLRSS